MNTRQKLINEIEKDEGQSKVTEEMSCSNNKSQTCNQQSNEKILDEKTFNNLVEYWNSDRHRPQNQPNCVQIQQKEFKFNME